MANSPKKNTNVPFDYVASLAASDGVDFTAISGKPTWEPILDIYNTTGADMTVTLVQEQVQDARPGVSSAIAGATFEVVVGAGQHYIPPVPIKSLTSATGTTASLHLVCSWWDNGSNQFNP